MVAGNTCSIMYSTPFVLVKGYVIGEVFPIIQNMDKFTKKATSPEANTVPYKIKINTHM